MAAAARSLETGLTFDDLAPSAADGICWYCRGSCHGEFFHRPQPLNRYGIAHFRTWVLYSVL